MATAHLIYGYLGAGKTAFARRLEIERRAVRFTHDEWMSALYGADPPREQFADYYDRVHALMDKLWARVLGCGVDVVLDYGLWTRAARDDVRDRVRSLGAASKLYWLRCDDGVALARCRARNVDPRDSLYIADATFDALKARFEPLGDDEAYELVDTSDAAT